MRIALTYLLFLLLLSVFSGVLVGGHPQPYESENRYSPDIPYLQCDYYTDTCIGG